MTGKSFHPITSVTKVGGMDVGVSVRVGAGVIGEYFLGLWVAVGNGAATIAGNVCVGALTGILKGRGVEVTSPVQAVIKLQTIKVRIKSRFIAAKYSGGKLINDEFLCYRVPPHIHM
jgi:hypothetical protein